MLLYFDLILFMLGMKNCLFCLHKLMLDGWLENRLFSESLFSSMSSLLSTYNELSKV